MCKLKMQTTLNSSPSTISPGGIILLDKPTGYSSNFVLQSVRRLFGKIKAGHTGCLDPLATGMLPICLGEATKFSQFILDKDKTYLVTGQLGVTMTTGDADGEVLCEVNATHCTEAQLLSILPRFLGETLQIPPMYSALKHQGQPLYKLARKGQVIPRAPRRVVIDEVTLQYFRDCQFQILVRCSKGTYMRTLVEDIGEALGVGSHVIELRRLSTAGFERDVMYTLDELNAFSDVQRHAVMLPLMRTVDGLPVLTLTEEQQRALSYGQTASLDADLAPEGCVTLLGANGDFFGVGEVVMGTLKVKRLLAHQMTEKT
ncbi:MAG: tRNA pseudouridine(55) synthase TruB [Gammaproteobacteria bacterium]|nr:tRNA pseudouridine(55) synthase TruB [Gammaproteobacteria bacterium]